MVRLYSVKLNFSMLSIHIAYFLFCMHKPNLRIKVVFWRWTWLMSKNWLLRQYMEFSLIDLRWQGKRRFFIWIIPLLPLSISSLFLLLYFIQLFWLIESIHYIISTVSSENNPFYGVIFSLKVLNYMNFQIIKFLLILSSYFQISICSSLKTDYESKYKNILNSIYEVNYRYE